MQCTKAGAMFYYERVTAVTAVTAVKATIPEQQGPLVRTSDQSRTSEQNRHLEVVEGAGSCGSP